MQDFSHFKEKNKQQLSGLDREMTPPVIYPSSIEILSKQLETTGNEKK